MYNKPKLNEAAAVNEYSGFLMALGLNGHLTKLTIFNVHDYLCKVSKISDGSWSYQPSDQAHHLQCA